jgi:hypothetical protein
MSRIGMMVVSSLTLTALAALGTATEQAGGVKAPAWKTFLPDQAYEELTRRSLERIGALAKTDKGLGDLRAEALILAGYTLSARDGPDKDPVHDRAVALANLLNQKGGADAARKLAAEIAAGKASVNGAPVKDWRAVIGDINDVMILLATKARMGEGIHADLQYNDKMKKQNGIEALINALAAKKLTDANLAKMSKELELLGYRVATMGALTLRRGPPDKKKGVDDRLWDEQAVAMRDAAIEWAHGAGKKDGPTILEACKRLENTCVECHSKFK